MTTENTYITLAFRYFAFLGYWIVGPWIAGILLVFASGLLRSVLFATHLGNELHFHLFGGARNISFKKSGFVVADIGRQSGGWRRRRVLRRIWVAHSLGFGFSRGADLESTHRKLSRS